MIFYYFCKEVSFCLPNMRIIKVKNDSPSERQISELSRDLNNGLIAVIPTDTIYAIVCDALDSKAIDRICRLKGINPEKTNLSIICSDIREVSEYARVSDEAFKLIKRLTPGPFTFLLPSTRNLPRAFKGRKTVGIRIPDSKTALSIVRGVGHPLLTTSIEFEDLDYARNPELISEAYHEKVDIVVEGPEGNAEPSTVLDLTGKEAIVVREGKGKIEL